MPFARRKPAAKPKREYKSERLELRLAPSAKRIIQQAMPDMEVLQVGGNSPADRAADAVAPASRGVEMENAIASPSIEDLRRKYLGSGEPRSADSSAADADDDIVVARVRSRQRAAPAGFENHRAGG